MTIQSTRVVILTVVSFLMAALRTIIVVFRMEKNELTNESYYLSDKPEVAVFAVACVVLMVLFAVTAVWNGRKKSVYIGRSVGSVPAGSLVMSFSLVFAVFRYVPEVYLAENPQYTVIGLFVLATSVLTAARFFYTGLFCTAKHSVGFLSFTALAPILLTMFRLLGDFIKKSAAPFSSSGAYHFIGLIAVMLFFLLEGKSYLSPASATLYYFFGNVAVLFLLVYSVPDIVLHCFGAFKFDYHTAYSVADLGIATYIATSLSYVKIKTAEKQSDNL